jgi:flagellar biosynthesis protein FlhB
MNAASVEHRALRPSSRSLSASVALLALVLALDFEAARAALGSSFEPAFVFAGDARSVASLSNVSVSRLAWQGSGRALIAILGPLLAAIVAGVLAAGIAQLASSTIGQPGRASGERPARFDAAARVRQLFSPERAIDALFALFSLASLSLVAWLTIAPNVRGVLALPGADVAIAAPQLVELFGTLALRLMLTGLALGALDYVQRRVRHARGLRMTRRELLEEQRAQYGDPSLRAERIRQRRADAARRQA